MLLLTSAGCIEIANRMMLIVISQGLMIIEMTDLLLKKHENADMKPARNWKEKPTTVKILHLGNWQKY